MLSVSKTRRTRQSSICRKPVAVVWQYPHVSESVGFRVQYPDIQEWPNERRIKRMFWQEYGLSVGPENIWLDDKVNEY